MDVVLVFHERPGTQFCNGKLIGWNPTSWDLAGKKDNLVRSLLKGIRDFGAKLDIGLSE